MIIDIPTAFKPYLDEALLRFSYIHPTVEVQRGVNIVELATDDPSVVASFRHTLYRQKIYRETAPLRQALIEGILR